MVLLLLISAFTLESCSPIVISSQPEQPLPPWFYPNRVEAVRYVYFPEYKIYYDLSLGNYLYLDNNAWVRVNVLPERFSAIKLNRSKFVRVKNYRGNNIRIYHNKNNASRNRTNNSSTGRRRN